ncbi:MAG: cytochrome b [Micropepsaceae bacterium]
MAVKTEFSRYSWVAVTLHWVIAIAILYMVYLGKTMDDDYVAIQLHKSLGITILALSLLRLIWRFVDPPPPLPSGMNMLERIGAKVSHWGFYFLMIFIPLSGWALASTSPFKTKVWGVIDLPKLPGFAGLDPDALEQAADRIESIHETLAFWPLLLLVGLHVGAALKHHFRDRDNVLTRMIPFIPAPRRPS